MDSLYGTYFPEAAAADHEAGRFALLGRCFLCSHDSILAQIRLTRAWCRHRRQSLTCGKSGWEMVRAAGVEPAQALRPYGFSYHFGFHRHPGVFVVWTIPSPWRVSAVGAARLVSTPSPSEGAWLGIAM